MKFFKNKKIVFIFLNQIKSKYNFDKNNMNQKLHK